MKVSVIIPCYNEEDNIAMVIERVQNVDLGSSKEIIVIDDCSIDNSANIVSRIRGVKLIRHIRNLGKGGAIHTGLKEASGDLVVIQDADLEYAPEEIPRLLKPILEKKADVVYGSRFLGRIEDMTFWHFVGNKILSYATRFLYNVTITDVMTGYKVFKRRVLDKIELKARGFEFEVEITIEILKKGYSIVEVPIAYAYRERGKSKINWMDGMISLWWLLKSKII